MGNQYPHHFFRSNRKVASFFIFIPVPLKIKMIQSLKERILLIFLYIVGAFVVCSLATQLLFVGLDLSGNSTTASQIAKELMWKLDSKFSSVPINQDKEIYVQSVTNNIKVGKLAGSRNLEFGIKNILEEYLQDKGYNITPLAPNYLDIDIVYLDVLTTKSNLSVFHKNQNEVIIRLKGTLYKEGTKVKEVLVEESSSEISMSTLIIDQGGKFNQTSLSNALKKGCDKLITKIFEK